MGPDRALLEGAVQADTPRASLRAERLELRLVQPQVIEVQGSLRLQPCPCVGAPLALDARRARLVFDGEVLDQVTLEGATLRLRGIPVLPLPWLQLRSEKHWGLLPPRAALRGRDGPLLGAGLHAPLGPSAGLSLEPALYLRGGHEVLASARLGEGSLRARWDRREHDLFALQGQGRAVLREGAVLWSVDALRGPRARPGTIDLEAAARPYDQGKMAWIVPWGGSFSTGFRAFAPRGEGAFLAGPQVSWAGSRRGGEVAWWLDGMTVGRDDGAALSLARAELRLGRAWWWGALRLRPEALALGTVGAGGEPAEGRSWAHLRARGLLRADVPLLRRGEGGSWRLEPGVQAGALGQARSGQEPAVAAMGGPEDPTTLASLFVRNFWTRGGGWAELRPEVGVLLGGEGRQAVGRGVLALGGGWARGWLDGATVGRGGSVVAVGGEVGRARGWKGSARLDGQQGRAPLEARWMSEEAPWLRGWFARPAWSAEAGVEAPLGGGLRAGARGWADLVAGRWLGHRMDLLYEARCGCLRVGVHGARRLGREGVDLWGSLSLG